MKINLPFRPEFKDKMLSGLKVCSSRTKRYGKTGDTFLAFGAEFIIAGVSQNWLAYVAEALYESEGFDMPGAFIECWKRIHPRKGYRPEQKVFVHWFRRVE